MKRKNVVRMLALLTVLSIATLFGMRANSQTTHFFMETIEFKVPTPHTTPEEYAGPQTVQGLMDAFDADYNRRYSKARVIASRKGGVYKSELAISGEIDARYPRAEWLQMLLDRGITIENFDDYRVYLSKRHTLAFLEDTPELRKAGFLGIPPTDAWETYKAAYIEKLANNYAKKIRKAAERAKQQAERAKAQIERGKEQVERAKKQVNSRQLEHARKQLEHARKQFEHARQQLEHARQALERAQKLTLPSQAPNRHKRKRAPYSPL